jgi:hypothetical protein
MMNQPHNHPWDESCGPECPRHDPVEPYDSTREELVEDTRRPDAPYPAKGMKNAQVSGGLGARIEINAQGTKVYDVNGDRVELGKTVNILDPELPIEEFIGQAVGAASMCWENPEGAGVFDSERAERIAEELTARISEALR